MQSQFEKKNVIMFLLKICRVSLQLSHSCKTTPNKCHPSCQARFQVNRAGKIYLNVPSQGRPPTPLIRPLFRYRKGGFIKVETTVFHLESYLPWPL